MAGLAIISRGVNWFVGRHGFYPIIDRIRRSFPMDEKNDPDQIFSTLDQGLDIISLEDVNQELFIRFYQIACSELQEFRNSHGVDISHEFYDGIIKCWEDLIRLMEQDPRFTAIQE